MRGGALGQWSRVSTEWGRCGRCATAAERVLFAQCCWWLPSSPASQPAASQPPHHGPPSRRTTSHQVAPSTSRVSTWWGCLGPAIVMGPRKQADSLSAERQRHSLPRCGSRVELWTLEVQFGHGAVPGAVGHGPGGLNGAAGRPMEWFGIPFHFCFNSTHATAPLHFTDDAMIRNLFI